MGIKSGEPDLQVLPSCFKSNNVSVHGYEFSELKIPYDTLLVADFADLECEASAKSRYCTRMRVQ